MRKKLLTAIIIMVTTFNLNAQVKHTNVAASNNSIPKEYIGHWQKGTFSLTSFQEHNGKYVGPANETSISYVISESGICREYFISNTNTYNCRMEILGFREGKIEFNTTDNSFEFQPTNGYYSTLTCMNKVSTKKNYSSNDLYPGYNVKCQFKKDENGTLVLVTNNSKGTSQLTLKKID